MKGDPWQAQINADGRWVSIAHDGSPYVFALREEAASFLIRYYPDIARADRLDRSEARVRVINTDTGETFPAWEAP
jgi:hypothetical protein